MKLEQNDKSILFSTTEIPDVFFTEYLSSTNGDFIKVYLYIFFLSKYNRDIKLADVAKALSLPFKTIQEAFDYWENLDVIIKKPKGYIVNSLQEIELNKLYSPKVNISPEDLEKNSKNEYRAKAIENINSLYFQGIMSPSWYSSINLWFKKYGFDEQVMLALFDYCFNKSALHKNYVQTVADAWGKNNIRTFTDLDNYFEKQEKLNTIKKSISKKLGYHKDLSQFESAYVEKWIVDYGYDMSIIDLALKKTTSKVNPTFDYFDKLISSWHDRNLKSVSEIQNFMEEMKAKNKSVKELEKKATFNSYNQRDYKDLDAMYENMQEANNG